MIPCARKVFSDTVASILDGMPMLDVLHRSAAEDLLTMAQDTWPDTRQLSDLPAIRFQAVLDRIIEHDSRDQVLPLSENLADQVK
jgi:hypothetical protein